MEKTVKKKNRRFSREFKITAVRRVLAGEPLGKVARELELNFDVLWTWKKRVVELGEHCLYGVGRRRGAYQKPSSSEGQERRIAELERLIGRQQMEIRFLDKALRRVEELRQGKNDDGEAASSK
jgi:transposase-like protein